MSDRGRSGRTRVAKRLTTAAQGAVLLDRKDRILGDELQRLRLREQRAKADWERYSREAAEWLVRAAALDGRARLTAARPAEGATVLITWGASIGVAYPYDVTCEAPVAPPAGGSSALSFAAASHRQAVASGARYAGVRRAIGLVDRELSATRVRRRAIENRWIPRLTAQLATINRELDEQELEDVLRMRWAGTVRRAVPTPPSGSGART